KVSIPSRDVKILDSHFTVSGRQGIAITSADTVEVRGNHISGVARSMFDLEPNTLSDDVRNVTISDNITGTAHNFWFASKGAGSGVHGLTISGNRMTTTTGALFLLKGHPDGGYKGPATIRGNTLLANNAVSDKGSNAAFYLNMCENVTMTGNKIT